MPRPKPTPEDLKARKVRAKEWIGFRKKFKFSQKKLAEAVGVSRRTIQMIEMVGEKTVGTKKIKNAADRGITPHARTLTLFQILKNKWESEHSL